MTELLQGSSNMTQIPKHTNLWVLSGNLPLVWGLVFDAANSFRLSRAKNHATTISLPRRCVASRHPFISPRKGCNVTRINLYRRDLHGSLAKEFGELRALETLDLRYTNITGNLDVLKESTALRWLYLPNTQVSGNLQSLAKATGLNNLCLRGTQVSGDLVALKNAKGLWFLDLSETKVYGNLGSLANLTKLFYLQLSSTKVSGDLSVILQRKKIGHLGLSGTKVTSHPTEKWQNCCEHLETLELAWTEVRIMDEFLASFLASFQSFLGAWNCPFPALTTLDMTGTPLNTTVAELLRPFVGCQKLRIFKAAECSLTGPMPERLREFDYIDTWPLSQVLQLLDLSSNNVTKVEALPHNCRAVSFRDSPQISFGKDVVKKATDHFVSLDLRNASFAHPSDARSSKDLSNVFKVGASRPIVCGQSFWPLICFSNACINYVKWFSSQLKRVQARPDGILCMSYELSPRSH